MAGKVGRREEWTEKVGRREIYAPVPPASCQKCVTTTRRCVSSLFLRLAALYYRLIIGPTRLLLSEEEVLSARDIARMREEIYRTYYE